MKKLLLLPLILVGGIYFVKNEVSITQDNQLRVASLQFPIPPVVQASPVYGMLTMMAKMQTAPAATAAPAAPPRPAMPSVTSSVSTYNPNPQPQTASNAPAPANVADQFNAVSKALRGQ